MFFKKLTIRFQILALVVSITGIVVGLLSALTILQMRNQLQEDLKSRGSVLSSILAQSVASGLDFSDTAFVADVVAGTMSQDDIKEILIVDIHGHEFFRLVKFEDEHHHLDTGETLLKSEIREDADCLLVGQPAMLHLRPVGTTWLRLGKESMQARVKRSIELVGFASIAVLLLIVGPVVILSRRIVRPLQMFENAVTRVSHGVMSTPIEAANLGVNFSPLANAFNSMQTTLKDTFAELELARNEMETRVRDRTQELEIEVIERRRAEDSLRDREGLLRATLEATGDGILAVDNGGHVTHWNGSFRDLWRIPPDLLEERNDERLINFVLAQLVDPEGFVEKVKALYLSSAESFDVIEFKDGRAFERYSRPLIRNDDVLGRVWSFRDITPRRASERSRQQLQEQLDRAERMESLGLLAGGVAHDLNNMLGPIVGYSELLARELPNDSKSALKARKIGKAAEDAAAVIQDLLTLARRGRCEMLPLTINSVIEAYLDSPSFEKLQERHPDITVTVSLADAPGTMLGSDVHLGKAIMNLVTNAFEAMPTGGTLTIRSECVQIEKLYSGYQNIDEGKYTVVRVRDTGSGISKEDVARIFEPYFSKKKMGQSGSGLGLSVVYGIVKDHRGYYDIESDVGKGTEFMLYFPTTDDSISLPEDLIQSSMAGKGETILIIDDSLEQREMAREIIESMGYSVRVAEHGHAGVESIRKQPADLIVLDMIMEPGFDGLDTYREILEIHRHQKAIVVSGFSATERVQAVLDLGAGGFVKKPYKIDTLARALRSALDNSPASQPTLAATSITQ